jgi:hypothetical protein
MRRRALIAGALSLVFAASAAQAQDKPNFAGTWTLCPEPTADGGVAGGGLGQIATITQDAKTLTLTRTTQAGEIKAVYNLDGSDSKNMVNMRGGQVEQVSKATWESNKLTISTNFTVGENAITTTQSFSLDASGQLIHTTSRMARGGAAPATLTSKYTKG